MRTNNTSLDALISSEPFWTNAAGAETAPPPVPRGLTLGAVEPPRSTATAAALAERLGRALAPLLGPADRAEPAVEPQPARARATPHLQYPPRPPVFGRYPEYVRS